MVLKSQLDELIETLTDYTKYLSQFGYDDETIFCAYAVTAMYLTGEKNSKNIGKSIMKKVKSINVVESTGHTVH
tara:strand:+ start:309 stop:530 length:222 start_codon:yes stop_codon:yes gene_type:complete